MKYSLKNLKILSLVGLGSALEFYDFTIYGLFSYYLSDNFFPKTNQESIALNFIGVLMVFGVGYVARPLGGLIFGTISDKRGRKSAFSLSLIIMASSTFIVGLLPTYNQIGMMAPVMFLALRIIQGISMGAELPISSVFIFEHLSAHKLAFYGASLFGLANFGLLIGNCFNLGLINYLSQNQIIEFGWRIPFLFGGILGILSIYLRYRLQETPIFKHMNIIHIPWKTMISYHKPALVATILISMSYGLCVNFGFVLLFSILEHLYKIPVKSLALINLTSVLLFCVIDSLLGFIVDKYKINLSNIIFIGIIQFCLSFSLVLFSYSHNYLLLGLLASIWLTLATSCFDSSTPNILPKLFPPQIRGTGVSFGYSLGLGLSGLITTVISSLIIANLIAVWVLPILVLIIHTGGFFYYIKYLKNNTQLII